MKELLDLVLNQQNQSNVNDIAQQFGIDASQAQQAIGALIPGMTQQLQQRVQHPQEGRELLQSLEQNQFSQYIDDDNLRLTGQEAQQQGESLLGQIFGGQDAQQRTQLSNQAAQQTGMDSGMLSKMLPMLAPMLMGSLGKQAQGGGGVMSLLSSLGGLDSDGDGRPDAGGIIGKLMSLFRR